METVSFTPIEQRIIRNYARRSHLPGLSDADWPIMNSGVLASSGDAVSYYRRFAEVLPYEKGLFSFETWVAHFEAIHGRKPLTLELMGNEHFMSELNLEGIFINKQPDYRPGIYLRERDLLEINSDLENLPVFFPLLEEAMSLYGCELGFDLIVWKGEGGLNCLLQNTEAYAYWWERLTSLLRSGGSAFIQNPFYMDNNITATSAIGRFQKYMEGKAKVVYDRSDEFNRFYMRIDKF